MRETIAGLKLQVQMLEQRLEMKEEYIQKRAAAWGEREAAHAKELEKIRTTTAASLKLNHRLACRNDALQWSLYMAQMVSRSAQEKLEKCERLVGITGDKLSIAS